jgi:hypothetical protein
MKTAHLASSAIFKKRLINTLTALYKYLMLLNFRRFPKTTPASSNKASHPMTICIYFLDTKYTTAFVVRNNTKVARRFRVRSRRKDLEAAERHMVSRA